jgi:hypothetical protein
MWNAFTNDLIDFVHTIKSETTSSLSQVIGGGDGSSDGGGSDEVDELAARITDLRRSFFTFSEPIEPQSAKDYDRFKKKFSLPSVGSHVAELLDQVCGV